MLNIKIGAESGVTGDVSQNGQRACGNHHAPNGQAVQTICEVHGIRRAHHHQNYERQKWQKSRRPEVTAAQQGMHNQVGPKILEERHDQLRRVDAIDRQQEQRKRCGEAH